MVSGSGSGNAKPGPGPGYIRVKKINSGPGFFYIPVRVQPGPDYPGSSGSGPGPGYFAIPSYVEYFHVLKRIFDFVESNKEYYVEKEEIAGYHTYKRG